MADKYFNLLDEKWIPVINQSFQIEEISLIELFRKPKEYKSIYHQSPLVEWSIYKFLLVLLHRGLDIFPNTKEFEDIFNTGSFDNKLFQYLEQWREHFYLKHPEYPFFQVSNLKSGNESVNQIIPNMPIGNNEIHYNHHFENEKTTLQPQEAIRYLLFSIYYSIVKAGRPPEGLDKKFGFGRSPFVQGIQVLITGNNLFETLVINLISANSMFLTPYVALAQNHKDQPIWETSYNMERKIGENFGFFDTMTFLSRQILFNWKEKDSSTLFVDSIKFERAIKFGTLLLNPYSAYHKSKKDEMIIVRFNEEKSVWRNLPNLLFTKDLKESKRTFFASANMSDLSERSYKVNHDFTLTLYGALIINQTADVIKHIIKSVFIIPNEIMRSNDLQDYIVSMVDETAKIEYRIISVLKKTKISIPLMTNFLDQFWSEAEFLFHEYFLQIPNDPDGKYDEFIKSINALGVKTIHRIANPNNLVTQNGKGVYEQSSEIINIYFFFQNKEA